MNTKIILIIILLLLCTIILFVDIFVNNFFIYYYFLIIFSWLYRGNVGDSGNIYVCYMTMKMIKLYYFFVLVWLCGDSIYVYFFIITL